MIRFLTAGESHGPSLTAVVDGFPAGLPVTAEYIDKQLKRRQGGYGRGGRMKIESDRAVILSGIRGGYSLGSPITLSIENRDWSNWQKIMEPGPGADLSDRVVTRPRPGHADLSGAIKYGHRDMRNVLERSSARETAARVAAGALARRLLEELGVQIVGLVTAIGTVRAVPPELPPEQIAELAAASEVYCPDPAVEKEMIKAIDIAREEGDSLGGVFEIRIYGLPPGVGGFVQWDRRLDGRLAGAMMGIQAIKGVEVGLGFNGSAMPGSLVHDDIFYSPESGYFRRNNGAGGIEGGMTNGETVVVRAAMKPIPTLYKPKQSVDIETREAFVASVERSDVCAVPAACVVGEAAAAWELAGACLEKFGGDNLSEIKERWSLYLDRARKF
jgi:chorismate synthase